MSNGAYKKKPRGVFIYLNIVSPKVEHFGKFFSCVPMYMEEVDPDLIRGMSNWTIDKFRDVYSTTLLLPAM